MISLFYVPFYGFQTADMSGLLSDTQQAACETDNVGQVKVFLVIRKSSQTFLYLNNNIIKTVCVSCEGFLRVANVSFFTLFDFWGFFLARLTEQISPKCVQIYFCAVWTASWWMLRSRHLHQRQRARAQTLYPKFSVDALSICNLVTTLTQIHPGL